MIGPPNRSRNRRRYQIGAGGDTAMVVVDARRIIRYCAIWRDHRDHPGYRAILQTLQSLSNPNQT